MLSWPVGSTSSPTTGTSTSPREGRREFLIPAVLHIFNSCSEQVKEFFCYLFQFHFVHCSVFAVHEQLLGRLLQLLFGESQPASLTIAGEQSPGDLFTQEASSSQQGAVSPGQSPQSLPAPGGTPPRTCAGSIYSPPPSFSHFPS